MQVHGGTLLRLGEVRRIFIKNEGAPILTLVP